MPVDEQALPKPTSCDAGTNYITYVQVGQQTIADYVAGSVTSSPMYRYVYASYIDEPVIRYEPSATETLYFHRSQQYSITALTDSSGTIVERYAYSAYGSPTITGATGTLRSVSNYDNRYTYTAREWDGVLFMYHFRARIYDAELGRFLARDPISYEDGQLLYKFLGDSPFIAIDPSGKTSVVLGIPPQDQTPFHPCKVGGRRTWTMSLDQAAETDGWIIQRVCVGWLGGPGRLLAPGSHRSVRAHIRAYGSSQSDFRLALLED